MRDEFTVLSTFLAVAEARSFSKAAKRCNLSPSAVSHAIRRLEEQVGVRLLARTTRSVAVTEAGQKLLARVRPAFEDIRGALDDASGLRHRHAGRVRLLVPRFGLMAVLGPKLGQFARAYPDIVLDVTSDDTRGDLVARGFDAGVQLGEYIHRDMVAVRISRDRRAAVVGAPAYFVSRRRPRVPRDLLNHRCIAYRQGATGIYHWEFEKGKQSITLPVSGPLVVDDVGLVVQAALDGVGLAFVGEEVVSAHVRSGGLVRVLDDWCQPYPGFFLYYPSRRHQPATLTALIETLRL